MRQPVSDIRAMCAEVDRAKAEEQADARLYFRWVMDAHALDIISPWLKTKPKRMSFDEFKSSLKKAARKSQKPDRAAFHAAYGTKIKKPKGG